MAENPIINEQIPAENKQEQYPGFEQLKERVLNIETKLGQEGAHEQKQETIKEEIKSHLKEIQQQSPVLATPLNDRDEAKEIRQFDPDQQVQALVSLVFEKGLNNAVSIAKSLDNPAILDSFHDALADKYYEKLVQEGVIK